MGGNKDMWLALADPMMAQLTGNDWAEEHKREINTSAAAAAAIAALIFSGGSAAPALAGAAGAGEAAAAGAAGTALTGAEVAAMYGGGTALSASEIAAMYGAGAAGTTGAEAAALDAYMMGAAGGTEGGLLSAGSTAAIDPYMAGAASGAGQGTLPALEGFGGGTASLFGPEALQGTAYGGATGGTASLFGPEAGFASSMLGNGAAQPTMGQIAAGANANAAAGPSAWDRIGKGLDTYNKYSKIAGAGQGLLAPPQQPQTPQPRPLSMGQAKQQQGPTDWAQFFGPGLSDDEIRKRQLMMMQYGYGAH